MDRHYECPLRCRTQILVGTAYRAGCEAAAEGADAPADADQGGVIDPPVANFGAVLLRRCRPRPSKPLSHGIHDNRDGPGVQSLMRCGNWEPLRHAMNRLTTNPAGLRGTGIRAGFGQANAADVRAADGVGQRIMET